MMKSDKTITVQSASEYLGCSTRRIRALLAQGRMTGHKVGTTWHVMYPIQCTVGQRGPLINLRKPSKNAVAKRGINSTKHINHKTKGAEILSTAENQD